MKYLLDLCVHDREGPFAQLTNKLHDRSGRPLENMEMPVAVHEIRKGMDVRDVEEAYLSVRPQDRLADHLWYRVRGNPCFSEEVVSALDGAGLSIDPAVYRLPLYVTSRRGGPVRRRYFILWATQRRHVLNLARAEVTLFPGTDVIQKVNRWVLDPAETPDFDLFATPYFEWIASARLKDLVERERFSGFSFVPLP